jgi:regulator of sigma E protease
VVIHEWGHFFAAKKSGVLVHEFGLGLGKKIWGKTYGETEFTINAIPFGGFVRMLGEEENSNDPRSFAQAALWKRMWITLNGIFMNLVFSITVFTVLFSIGSAPIILSEADFKVAQQHDLVVQTEDVDEDGKAVFRLKEIQLPVHRAFAYSLTEHWRITNYVFIKLGEIPAEIRKNKKIPDTLSGPVGIAEATHKILPYGFKAILKLAALLSLSLAIMNILPIPALDGGRFLFQIIELILKPFNISMDAKFENQIHMIGFGILITLIVVITGNDIWRIFS